MVTRLVAITLKCIEISIHFPCGSAGKESTCNAGDLGSILGLGRSLGEGKGYPLQYSGLQNSMDFVVHWVTKSQTWLSDFTFLNKWGRDWINEGRKNYYKGENVNVNVKLLSPGSSVHGIFQAIVLEWIAISFSKGSSQPKDRMWVSRIVDRRFTIWATREVLNLNFIMSRSVETLNEKVIFKKW